MRNIIGPDPAETDELRSRIEAGDAVSRMMATEGWRIVESNLREQLAAYVADNAANAKDWSDYQSKAGKIHGIQLLLVDIDDYLRQGSDAAQALDTIERESPTQV